MSENKPKENCSVCEKPLAENGIRTVVWMNKGYAHKRHDSRFRKAKEARK